MMHYGTEINASQFGVKRSRVKVNQGNKVYCKQHFLGLLTRRLESVSRIFTLQLTPVMYYGTEMNALNFDVKRSKFKVSVE